MNYGISSLSLIAVRAEPSHRSEMVSQLLFGEHFEILSSQDDWLRIRMCYDDYEGWIPAIQSTPIEDETYRELEKQEMCVSYDLVQIAVHERIMQSVVLGSSLPYFKGNKCRIGELLYNFDGNARFPETLESSNVIIENAYMYLNCPYLWGGRSPFGIDCSGFTQMVFKLAGKRLRRDAWMQAEQGMLINLLDEAQPGDLAFFDNAEGKITHVGILLTKNKIIHASGRVRMDMIDHHGIFNEAIRKYTHHLRLIKRLI